MNDFPQAIQSLNHTAAAETSPELLTISDVADAPLSATLQRSDPQAFSRTKVSISAAYGEDDGRTEWVVVDHHDGYVHIELYELRYIGPPFNHDSRIQVLSLMVTREQKEALLCELRGERREGGR